MEKNTAPNIEKGTGKESKIEGYRDIFLLHQKSDILKRYKPNKKEIENSKNTPGWVTPKVFLGEGFFNESEKLQILFLEVLYKSVELSELQMVETYPEDTTTEELVDLVKTDDFAISQYSIVERGEDGRLKGLTFIESSRTKQATKEYIAVLQKLLDSNLLENPENEYLKKVIKAFSSTKLTGHYPEVWEDCDKAYLKNNSKYSLNFHGEEDYLDPFHNNNKVDFDTVSRAGRGLKKIFKNSITGCILMQSNSDFKTKFQGLDKRLFSYFKNINHKPSIDSQENIEFRELILSGSKLSYMSADTTPNNPKNGKKIRFNIAKINANVVESVKAGEKISNNNIEVLKDDKFLISRMLLLQVHELSHSVEKFSNLTLEELKASYLGNYYLLQNPEEIEKMGISQREYMEFTVIDALIRCSEYKYNSNTTTNIYSKGDRIVIYKAIQSGSLKITNNKIEFDWEMFKEDVLGVGSDLLDFLSDPEFNNLKALNYISQVGDMFENGEVSKFIGVIKNYGKKV